MSDALDLPLRSWGVGVSIHAYQMVLTSEAWWALLSEGLVVGLTHSLAVSRNIAALEGHFVTKLRSSQVFGLILYNDLVEKVIFLVEVLFAKRLHGVALFVWVFAHSTAMLGVWIQVFQIDFVTVFVFKGVQATVRSLFEQELAKVTWRDKVVGLWLELFITILAPLTSVTLDSAFLLVCPYGAPISTIDAACGANNALLVLIRLFVNLTTVHILVLWIRLLQVARVGLVMLGWGWKLVEFLVLLHAYLGGNHGSRSVLDAILQVVLRIVYILLLSHVWAVPMSHVGPAHRHLANCTDRSDLIDGRAIVVVGMGGVVWPHGGPRFGGFSSMAITGLWVTSIVVWSMDLSLHDSFLLFKLAMSSYQLVDFRLSYLIKPWLSQAVYCR